MAKGYWIARVDVHDAEGYKGYVEAAAKAFAKYPIRFLVRGGTCHGVEGESRARNVVIEFPSLADARACYASPEYQAARAIRENFSTAEIVLVEGLEG